MARGKRREKREKASLLLFQSRRPPRAFFFPLSICLYDTRGLCEGECVIE